MKRTGFKPKTEPTEYDLELDRITPWLEQRSHNECEIGIPGVCTGFAEHRHHRKRRGQGGSNRLVNLLHSCGACHRFVHRNPKWALERRYLLNSWDDEALPVMHNPPPLESADVLEHQDTHAEAHGDR